MLRCEPQRHVVSLCCLLLALCRPFPLVHGVFGAANGVSMSGDIVSYTCEHGYANDNTQRNYTCLDTGLFNVKDTPQCKGESRAEAHMRC